METFLLTAAVRAASLASVILSIAHFVSKAVGMLFKRGSTISAAEGGCQAEVGGTATSLMLSSERIDLQAF